jgi:hypothetical protein
VGRPSSDGGQQDHVQHEWIHDALIFRVETSSIRHSLVGIPMRSIRLEYLQRCAGTPHSGGGAGL